MTPAVPTSLRSDGLLLRRFQTSDQRLLLVAVTESGTDLSRYKTWAKPGFTLDDASEYVNWWITGWRDVTAFFLAVALDGGLLGACGLFSIDLTGRHASLGYWVGSSRTGRGYASAAAQAAVRMGLDQFGLDRVDMLTAVTNTSSLGLVRRLKRSRSLSSLMDSISPGPGTTPSASPSTTTSGRGRPPTTHCFETQLSAVGAAWAVYRDEESIRS